MVAKRRLIRDVPGVIYAPLEDRARIQGTGIEPWLVQMTLETAEGDVDALRQAFDWLSEEQLGAALAFAAANPAFIRERIDREKSLDLEALWRDYPRTAPRQKG